MSMAWATRAMKFRMFSRPVGLSKAGLETGGRAGAERSSTVSIMEEFPESGLWLLF
jgi:hypothetical protein